MLGGANKGKVLQEKFRCIINVEIYSINGPEALQEHTRSTPRAPQESPMSAPGLPQELLGSAFAMESCLGIIKLESTSHDDHIR